MDDPTQMADAFNKFFSSIGSNIANSIPPTEVDPLSYITPHNYSNLLDLGNTGLIQVCDIIPARDGKDPGERRERMSRLRTTTRR